MIYDIDCPRCRTIFEINQLGEKVEGMEGYFWPSEGGNCPKCNLSFVWEFDCQYDDAILIPIWEKYEEV